MSEQAISSRAYEWPTFLALGITYLLWISFILFAPTAVAVIALIPLIAFHASLQHEVMHVIEPRWPLLGKIVTFPALSLLLPYIRYRDTHLAHHKNENLTDPLDDPESYYLPIEIWGSLNPMKRAILTANNTLIGRIFLGPIIGQIAFMKCDWDQIMEGNRAVLLGWLWHLPALFIVLAFLYAFSFPILPYLLACYLAFSILKIRTYLEHRAEEQANGRSVIIEDRGILAFLFLNNNYHAVHHAHPHVAWYNLPQLFCTYRERFLGQNQGYYYQNYRHIFRQFFLKCKEPVVHPIWRLDNRSDR